MKIYSILDSIVFYENNKIIIDICKYFNFIDIFSILEIFTYILNKYQSKTVKSIIINGNCEINTYLERINFKSTLEKLFGINNEINQNFYTGNNDLLQEIKLFSNKNEFYSINEKILNMFSIIGLNDDTSYLVLSSIGEIIDNSFFHNLGRWETKFGPTCLFLAQNYPSKRKLSFVISDLGIGFSNTLKINYPGLNTEKEYIEIALKPGITGRYQNKGGNGLVYLQKNIFNGFNGELFIRSNDELVKVESFGELKEIQSNLGMIGVSINFNLFY